MNHRFWGLGWVFLMLAGCAHQQTRLQSEDDAERDKEALVKTIGDVTSVGNAEPIPVSGVGIVVGLEGTGAPAPPGVYRTMLEEYLKKNGVENVKEVLASPNCSLVLVSAQIQPGARKGDPLDVDVSLPPQSKTTSLRGGYLKECILFDYDTARNLSPDFQGTNMTFKGHGLAQAEGPLLVGFGDGEESIRLRQGKIWGGGRSKLDRPFFLVLNNDQQYARVASRVADRINETFQGAFRSAPGTELASAKTKTVIYLGVPAQYRHNLPRFLRVVRMIPLQESPPANSPYRQKLAEDLIDPARTVTAALRLEALGSDTIPVLKRGLESKQVLVRFTSAEALAYLGSPSSGEVLAGLIEEQPALRAFCLTAMASLDEAVCHIKLAELLASSSAETRYGAFRALRALDEREPAIRGELLNDSFWVHRVSPSSSPLVHMSSNRRAEVVFFGEDILLQPPISILAGTEFTVTANRDDQRCTISRLSLHRGTKRRQCSLKLEDVVRTIADMGGTYPDVVELLRKADSGMCLTCRVAVDALPQATSVYDLAKAGKENPELLNTDPEIIKAKEELNATPTLFERSASRRSRTVSERDEEVLLRGRKPKETLDAAVRPRSGD